MMQQCSSKDRLGLGAPCARTTRVGRSWQSDPGGQDGLDDVRRGGRWALGLEVHARACVGGQGDSCSWHGVGCGSVDAC